MSRRRTSPRRWLPAGTGLVTLALAMLSAPAPARAANPAPAAPPVVVSRQEVAFLPQGGGWNVLEILTLVDTGSVPLTGVRSYVPVGATDLQLYGGVRSIRLEPDGTSWLSVPLPAGQQTDVTFSYHLPARRLRLAWQVPNPILQLVILLPRGAATLGGPDFHPAGTAVAGPLTFDAYLASTPSAGSVLHLVIAPPGWLGWVPSGLAGMAALTVALGLVGLGLIRRRRRGPQAARRAPDLVEAIAALDAAFARHELDAADYRDRRAALLDRLLRQADEDAAAPAASGTPSRVAGG